MAEELLSIEIPNINAVIQKLNLLDENVNRAVRKSMKSGADVIQKEQMRLIEDTSKRLAKAISKSKIYVNRKNDICISTGYQASTFRQSKDGNIGVIGMTFEFGRPGKSAGHSCKTMKQKRKRKSAGGGMELKEVEVNKGTIQPVPHIRRGFDNKVKQAAETVISEVQAEINRFERGG